MSQKKNVKSYRKGSGAASPEVGCGPAKYGKSSGQRNMKPVKAGTDR